MRDTTRPSRFTGRRFDEPQAALARKRPGTRPAAVVPRLRHPLLALAAVVAVAAGFNVGIEALRSDGDAGETARRALVAYLAGQGERPSAVACDGWNCRATVAGRSVECWVAPGPVERAAGRSGIRCAR